MTDPIPGPEVWPPTLEHRRGERSRRRHLAALRRVLADDGPTPGSRGVVWVGGGKYWSGIVVGVRLLRELGCDLPVEVWHRADEAVNPRDVAGLGVDIIDADAVADQWGDNRTTRGVECWGGWQGKLYALTHTRLDQVLYLDADAYCVADPAPLFDLLTISRPFVYWSDLPACDGCVKWPWVWPDGNPAGVPPVQGGQLLIDRRHGARLLRAAHWMCQHADYYFAHMYGDQDTWRVALAAGACGYRCLGPCPWRDVAFVCSHGGTDYVVHRCQGKLFPPAECKPCDGEASFRSHLPSEARVFDLWRQVMPA